MLAAPNLLVAACGWAGIGPDLLIAVRQLTGDFRLAREVAGFPEDLWGQAIRGQATFPGEEGQDDVLRTLSLLELSRLGGFRRACRLASGLASTEAAEVARAGEAIAASTAVLAAARSAQSQAPSRAPSRGRRRGRSPGELHRRTRRRLLL